eukprot:NODE_6530_length_449_cov_5.967500_g4974_i0.p4 GENE.NODE_6530_length_449_cov_5.967500_g4974_i0~~NODE_6530_length_449_cov_5.967500_g4974_i0.p4  ORF type:complete len:52 (-),score=1.73 NODE_6530_length_449_cov_5.967500_g4974_i0:68-223(-)
MGHAAVEPSGNQSEMVPVVPCKMPNKQPKNKQKKKQKNKQLHRGVGGDEYK